MAMFRTGFGQILDEGLRTVLMDELARREVQYTSMFNVLGSKKHQETDHKVGGFGLAQEVQENDAVPYETAKQGSTVLYTHLGYALGFRISKWMLQDDLYGVMKKYPRKLALSMIQTIEQTAAGVWNDAFAGATYTGLEGDALCSTAQGRIDGGTTTNRLATDADLTKTSLQNLWLILENTVDENGHPFRLPARKIIVPKEERFNVTELLRSVQVPDSQDNNMNSLQTLELVPFIYHYLTDADAWFLMAEEHEVNFFWRETVNFDSEDDFDTSASKHKSEMRFSVGFTDFRGIAGTSGA